MNKYCKVSWYLLLSTQIFFTLVCNTALTSSQHLLPALMTLGCIVGVVCLGFFGFRRKNMTCIFVLIVGSILLGLKYTYISWYSSISFARDLKMDTRLPNEMLSLFYSLALTCTAISFIINYYFIRSWFSLLKSKPKFNRKNPETA